MAEPFFNGQVEDLIFPAVQLLLGSTCVPGPVRSSSQSKLELQPPTIVSAHCAERSANEEVVTFCRQVTLTSGYPSPSAEHRPGGENTMRGDGRTAAETK